MPENNKSPATEANGDYTDYTYDSAYQLTRDWKRDNQNNSIYDYSYTFDASGNRLTMVDNMTQTTTNYTYDSLNRMTAAGNISYAFDDNGNTLSKTVNAQTTSYTYSYENWLTQITYPNQSTNTFSYDGGGIRFSKVDTAGTTKYVRDGDSLIAELDGTNAMVAAYTNGPNGLVSQRRNNATKFHHFDGLGSTRQLTDSTQTVTDTYAFDAYGNITGQTGNSTNPAKYVGSLGYYGDNDSGLMLLGERYYDPAVGRFITLDPIQDGINWYVYCENDPINQVDPEGEAPTKEPIPPCDGQKIADEAMKHCGLPYKKGGKDINDGPIDCSGFVWAVYQLAGCPYTYHPTATLKCDPHFMVVKDPQPGDIALWPGHCSIYMGIKDGPKGKKIPWCMGAHNKDDPTGPGKISCEHKGNPVYLKYCPDVKKAGK